MATRKPLVFLDDNLLGELPSADDVGLLESVVAGTNISVDNTDPLNPVVSATGGGGGQVDSITAADATVVVDATDPENPTVRITYIPTATIVGRNDGGTGPIEALTPAEVRTLINVADGATANVGTVTSVGMTVPPQFGVSGSPVTGSGALAVTWGVQAPNYVLAGPSAGGAADPTFRALLPVDIPVLPLSHISDALSGTYTPTVTNVSNTSARSGNSCQYMRVGDTVTVSGSFNVTATSAGGTQTDVTVSLPIASSMSAASHVAGAGNFVLGAVVTPCVIFRPGSNVAQVRWASASASAGSVYFQFSYRVI